MNDQEWIAAVREYCIKYNIPHQYLAQIINDPKVVPMIRGKAFEFSAMLYLESVLPSADWIVDKPVMNAQFGFHDMDVRVVHKATGTTIGVECKLAAKGSFQVLKNGDVQIKVKCMRSRTLGESKAKELAAKIGLPASIVQIHNDQYIPTDFQVVLTSIANAFYTTDSETDLFEWTPTKNGMDFLAKLSGMTEINALQSFAYNKMYLATSDDLAIKLGREHRCTRRACPTPDSCGFIPNYPVISFSKDSIIPSRT